MSISFAALLLAQTASAGSPIDVVVPNAIVSLHNEYVACQDKNFDIRKVQNRGTFKAEVERAIAACTEQKTTLMQQAEVKLAPAPEFRDPAVRQRAISEAFEGYDHVRRLMAAQ